MKLLRILSIALALMMGTAIHAEEKTVNGQPYVLLNNGIWMPRFGIGTYNVPGDSTACDAVSYALKCGYRHIDTAHAYRVERGVGKAVKQGKVRALGISNFDAADSLFHAIVDNAEIKPAVMQIELHPYAQRKYWQDMAKKYNIQMECWFPLGGEMSHGALFQDPTIKAIAKAHGKTPAQIIIRWHIQEGFSVIPGATRHDYIKENISVFDFKLTDEEMAKMRALNKEKRFFNMDYKQAEQFMLNWKIDD